METIKGCGNNYVKQENCEMSQIRRKSTGSKGNTSQTSSKNQNTEVINDEKSLDKQETSTGAKSTKYYRCASNYNKTAKYKGTIETQTQVHKEQQTHQRQRQSKSTKITTKEKNE